MAESEIQETLSYRGLDESDSSTARMHEDAYATTLAGLVIVPRGTESSNSLPQLELTNDESDKNIEKSKKETNPSSQLKDSTGKGPAKIEPSQIKQGLNSKGNESINRYFEQGHRNLRQDAIRGAETLA